MGLKSEIISLFTGEERSLKIGEEGDALVTVSPHPPINEVITSIPFRSYFIREGISTSINMAINGSVTPVNYLIEASEEYDIFIKYIHAEIGDGGSPNLNKFGDLTALTNGVGWYWFTQEEGEYELHEGIKTNKEFTIRIGNDSAGFGDGINAFLADVSGGASEKSYFPRIDIAESYGMPWGLRLRKGTTDRIIFRVSDDLSALTTFNIVAQGIRI